MTSFSRAEYEESLYSLAERNVEVTTSTLRLYGRSATTALVRGSVRLRNGLELRVFEYLDLADGRLLDYSYTVYRGDERIRWYDAQPHPENPALADTFPHHLHCEPNIKQNRKPAPDLSFDAPNLPALIEECSRIGG